MIGQRDVRWWDEMRKRRTRNIKKICADTAEVGFILRVSVRRSKGKEGNWLALISEAEHATEAG